MTAAPRLLPAFALIALLGSVGLRAELVDRVMAVVNNSVITLSDVNAAIRLRLIETPAPAGSSAVLERLIARRLTLAEVSRYAPPEPAEALVEARLGEVRARFATGEEFSRTLAEVGLTDPQLRAFVRDSLRIDAYLRQRFGAAIQPSDAEVLQYYRTHQDQFRPGGVMLTFEQASDDARAALAAERREVMVREWIATLRRRADITIPAVVAR
jgi:hypothetical protein